MKYCIENQLDIFEFHDCELSFISFENNSLVLSANHLNISKDAKENPNDCDMEISYGIITLNGAQILSFEPMRTYKTDDDGNWYTDEPQMIFKNREAEIRFLDELKNGITINCTDIRNENNKTLVEISTCAQSCFFATLSFDSIVIEWDEYLKKAWYELHKKYKYKVVLDTPDGKIKTDMHIVCHEEDMYYQGELEKAPIVDIEIEYENKKIRGHGKDYLWVDAFANLQKQLPEGVVLQCCMTCRYGNMCPYGCFQNELFCIKDNIINSKNDVCNWFDNYYENKMNENSHNCTDICEDYQLQSQDYYTYNDYLYYLDK